MKCVVVARTHAHTHAHTHTQGATDETKRLQRGRGRQEVSLAAHDQRGESGPRGSGALE